MYMCRHSHHSFNCKISWNMAWIHGIIGSNTTYSTGRDTQYVFGTSKRACDLKFYLDIDHQLPTSIKFGSFDNHNN